MCRPRSVRRPLLTQRQRRKGYPMKLDENGCPTELTDTGSCAIHCPPSPCKFCTGDSACRHPSEDRMLTGWEWCTEQDTCGATVDWELIFQGR